MKSSEGNGILLGRFDAILTEKHQIAFPKKYREILGSSLIVTKGIGQYVIAVAQKDWEVLLEGTHGQPFIDKSTREVQRYLLGNAQEVVCDAQGRFVVPEYLRRHAKMTKDAVFVGVRKYVEIWDRENWEAQQEYLSLTVESVIERLNREQK